MRASNTHPILSRLIHNKLLLGGLVGAIVVALGGTAAGYMAFSRTVTLSVDGHESKVRTFGDNVGDVLAAKGIKPDEHDSVVPSVDSPVNDGSRIAVRLGRPLDAEHRRRQEAHPVDHRRPPWPAPSTSSGCASATPRSR